ncbi:N-formylglutamate amidohydrolase [Geminicoccus flavidas]|uniref:N-formylglutamate amidohydrolase n=1 Tax=Geminicoccus flavidas TaxID=2506407 RepID=UPI00135A205F|nr:N-formylglutamate amidohydrolase [Geminicoccus flavidas]
MIDPFALVRPAGPGLPVLLSSPHSGRYYPEEARRRLGVAPATLAVLNDGPVHELLDRAVAAGATLLRARWNRTWIDLNRDPAELDEDAIDGLPADVRPCRSLRVQAGLGVVPTWLGERRIHLRQLPFAELAERIAGVHQPYHAALERECRRLAGDFGSMLLLDCHTMPGPSGGAAALPDIVLGDRFGRSCAHALVAAAEASLREAGFTVARNRPFAGGWITKRHGQPERGVHALQIELCRQRFFTADWQQTAAASALRRTLAALVRELAAMLPPARPLAAE